MRKTLLLCAILLAACTPRVTIEEPPRQIPFPTTATAAQLTCAASAGEAHCDGPDVSAALRALKTTPGTTTAAATITYHNDGIFAFDNSVEIRFRKWLLSDDSTGASPEKYDQHTHGKAHTLFVATRNAGKDTLTQYHLLPNDEVKVYLGSVNQPMPDTKILAGTQTADLILKIATLTLTCTECPHTGAAAFWTVTPTNSGSLVSAGPDIYDKNAQNLPVGVILRRKTPGVEFLRRIVIRNGGSLRQFIVLESGCSAFKICVRNKTIGCDETPLCKLDPAEMFSQENPNCRACRPQP